MTLFAGIDVGTSSVRCLVVDERGSRVAAGAAAWSFDVAELGFPTLSASVARTTVTSAVTQALSGCEARELAAVGVTSMRHGLAFIGSDGAELVMMPNVDGRAIEEAIAIEREHGDLIYEKTGRLLSMLCLPARLRWLQANRPEAAEQVHTALPLAGWVAFAATGEAATDPTLATELSLYDVGAEAWSDELIDALDVPRALLPRIVGAGEPAGVTGAEAFGLPAGLPVVVAGGDTQTAALALGLLDPGEAFVVAGTTLLTGVVHANAEPDAGGRSWTSPHALGGRSVRESHCGEAGPAVAWVARMLGTSVEELAASAGDAPAGAGGLCFVDPMPSTARDFPMVRAGAVLFPAPLLALGRGREDLARAVLEGVAFGARAGLGVLEETERVASVAAAGGVTRSPVFLDALAGAAERPVRAAVEPESSALGAAIAAAADHHGGVREAADAMHDRGREVAPRSEDGYPAHYATWRERAAELDARALRMSDFMR